MYNLVNHLGENSGLLFSDWIRDYSTVDANPQGKPLHSSRVCKKYTEFAISN